MKSVHVQNTVEDGVRKLQVLFASADEYERIVDTPGRRTCCCSSRSATPRFPPTSALALFAAAGVAEAWVVDLAGGRVLVHREPTADGYRRVSEHGRGGTLSAVAFPDLALAVANMLV